MEHTSYVMPHSDQAVLDRAEKILGRYFELAMLANCAAGVSYAEEALDGIRGVRTLFHAGLLKVTDKQENMLNVYRRQVTEWERGVI